METLIAEKIEIKNKIVSTKSKSKSKSKTQILLEKRNSNKKLIILYLVLGLTVGSFYVFVNILIHFGYQPLPSLSEILNSGKLILILMPYVIIANLFLFTLISKHIRIKERNKNKNNI